MDYSFNTDVAIEVGVEAAVIFQNIAWWCKKNAANEKHFHDGLYWTYSTSKALHDLFPFFPERKIARLVQKLKDSGLMDIGNYNRVGYDRTLWYAVTAKGWKLLNVDIPPFLKVEKSSVGPFVKNDKCICQNRQMEMSDLTNRFDENDKPIPDINTDINIAAKEQPQPEVSKVVTLYESNVHPLTSPIERDKLLSLLDDFQPNWIEAAIEEAALKNGRSLAYIIKILERWNRDGFKSDSRKKGSAPSQEPQRELTAEEREANYWKGIEAAIERNRADEERRRRENERLNYDPYSRFGCIGHGG